jgi:hypothetical protein
MFSLASLKMGKEKVKVLYIAGSGRSGSTLLDRTLGQIDGFFPVGELRNVWERGFGENRSCGCGSPFRECGFWKQVGKVAYGGLEAVKDEEILKVRSLVGPVFHISQLTSGTPRHIERLKEYFTILGRLYSAIREVSGCQVIVDSSKVPAYAYLLNHMPEIDLFVVHLVRDSRGVAYSKLKRKIKHIEDGSPYIPKFYSVRSCMRWLLYNFSIEWQFSTSEKYMLVRYEDFVDRPGDTISSILRLVQENNRATPFTNNRLLTLKPDHTVAGSSALRFENGAIELRRDEEWKTKMKDTDRLVVTLVTWPFLFKYGYSC